MIFFRLTWSSILHPGEVVTVPIFETTYVYWTEEPADPADTWEYAE